ncbi:Sugar transporter superfamily protein [Frankia canadensis]|uniref:Sugar transporter superfamily protein n=1 Tax=Frankia canadensis TaxID=1836972 RepID=A0A2I2KNN6_9ACTN|nr:glycosyltransferase 87 family protein [Frankia canadensis]SNQ47287.1 Sugar transporter superfamily protein [Frankia canadensis]SOU54577.1 Sugar transporter superfamily protein [Frankia canadensis]
MTSPSPVFLRRGAQAVGLTAAVVFTTLFLVLSLTSRLTDLQVYRIGGEAILHHRDLYAQVAPRSGLPFTYTPFAAILFVPLSELPVQVSQAVWTALLVVSLYLFCGISYRVARGPAASRPALVYGSVAGFALLLGPIRHNFSLGQVNIMLALLVSVDLFTGQRRVPRGILIGIAAGVKLTPLIFVPYLALTGRWRIALHAVASFAATIAAGFAVSPHSSSAYWGHMFLDASHVGGIPYVGNQSLLGVLSRLMAGADNARPVYQSLALAIVLIGMAASVALARLGEDVLGGLACALTGLLVSPISWDHHWVWMVPMLLVLFLHPARPAWGRVYAVACGVLLVLGPIWWVPRTRNVEFTHHGWQLVAANCYFGAGALLLVLLATRALARAGRVSIQPSGALVNVLGGVRRTPSRSAHTQKSVLGKVRA